VLVLDISVGPNNDRRIDLTRAAFGLIEANGVVELLFEKHIPLNGTGEGTILSQHFQFPGAIEIQEQKIAFALIHGSSGLCHRQLDMLVDLL